MLSKRFAFSAVFIFGKSQKSHGAKSREQGGCGQTGMCFFGRKFADEAFSRSCFWFAYVLLFVDGYMYRLSHFRYFYRVRYLGKYIAPSPVSLVETVCSSSFYEQNIQKIV